MGRKDNPSSRLLDGYLCPAGMEEHTRAPPVPLPPLHCSTP